MITSPMVRAMSREARYSQAERLNPGSPSANRSRAASR
jgi:hypothetical protein